MRDDPAQEAQRYPDLDPKVRRWLERLEPENIETLEILVEVKPMDMEGLMKLVQDGRTIARFLKWGLASLLAVFFIIITVGQGIQWVLTLLKGPPP